MKHWVKHAIDLEKDAPCFIKLVFHEKFTCRIGGIEFECFRSPLKEARILDLTRNHRNVMQGFAVTDGFWKILWNASCCSNNRAADPAGAKGTE